MLNNTRKYKISFILIFILFMSSICFAETDLEKATREQLMEILNDEQTVNDFMNEFSKENFKRISHKPISKNLRETSAVEMYIITIDEYVNAFKKFAEIKNEEGINTEVVSATEIGNSPVSIRLWLREMKQQNEELSYVLIGGDETAVPIKDFTYYDCGVPNLATTDFYYSNVLSKWPLDDNIYYIDPHTDLYVGRVPARSEREVAMFIDKYISYRYKYTQYTDAMAFIATNIKKIKNSTADNTMIDNIASHVPDYISKDMIYTYDLIDTVNGCAQPVVDELNNRDFSFLYLECHGGDAYCIYNSEYDDDSTWVWKSFGPNKRNDITINTRRVSEGGGWYNDLTGDSTDYYYASPPEKYWQLEDNVPNTQGQNYVTWIASCFTTDLLHYPSLSQAVLRDHWGEIIQTHHYPAQVGDGPIRIHDSEIPEWEENRVQCIAEAFFNEFGGPVALYASSCLDYPYFTYLLVQEYFDMLFEYNLHTLGLLTRDCWKIWFQYFQNIRVLKEIYVGYTLFGDPSMDVWAKPAKHLVTTYTNGIGSDHSIKAFDSSGNPVKATIVVLNEKGKILGRGISPYTYQGKIQENYVITSNSPNYMQSSNTFSKLRSITPKTESTITNIKLQNFPNPFTADTEISFSLKEHSHVKIVIYNVKGERVSTLMNENRDSGIHTIGWDAMDLSAGIYFIKLMINDKVFDIHKTIILR